jgi:glycerophosphoryl diester phosphodiesterase
MRISRRKIIFPAVFFYLLALQEGTAEMAVKADVGNPMIVAHRGASKQAPENTLPAFKLAWEQDADAIEGDFRLTKDGEIVCIHDRDTKRVTGVSKVVEESMFEELRNLDAGSWFGAQWKGTLIPTISEVLATVPYGKKIYIEIKSGPEILSGLFRELAKSGLKKDQIIVISFSKDVIRDFKKNGSGIKAFWLSDFKKDKLLGTTEPSLKSVLDALRETKADGFSSTHKNIDDSFIKTVQREGFEYHVWTVDDPETAQRFRSLGVKSITTNRPDTIRKSLVVENN